MKYTAVLNGCSGNFISQAEEIHGFLEGNVHRTMEGNTIIFYDDDNRKSELIGNSPTPNIKLIKVSRYQPENILAILKQLELNEDVDLYLFPSDFTGSELSVRFGYRMEGSSLVSVNKIDIKEGCLACHKAVYSNHMQGEFVLRKRPYCISIAKGCVDNKPILSIPHGTIFEIDMTDISKDVFIQDHKFIEEKEFSGLEDARFILIAGRGVKSKENVKRLEEIAKEIGAELGVSRPVVMSAWASMNQLVGVSGIMTKPELCIAAGVSGAAAFFAGVEKSKYIVAINTDEKASVIRSSDIAIIDDYERILEELLKIIKEAKH